MLKKVISLLIVLQVALTQAEIDMYREFLREQRKHDKKEVWKVIYKDNDKVIYKKVKDAKTNNR